MEIVDDVPPSVEMVSSNHSSVVSCTVDVGGPSYEGALNIRASDDVSYDAYVDVYADVYADVDVDVNVDEGVNGPS